MVLDYLSQNESLSYPFKDKCSLKAANNFQLPNDVFADAFIVAKKAQITGAFLKSITVSGGNILVRVAAVSDNSYTIVGELECVAVIADITTHKLISASSADFTVKIVLGAGFANIAASAPLTFTAANALFNAGAVIPYIPRVKSVTFKNLTTPLTVISADGVSDIALSIQEGSNISFTSENNTSVLRVAPGLGTGLYNGCDDDLVIKSINEIGPDTYGNFLFQTDGCYTTDKLTHGLFISNICTPKCTSEQLSSFAHYLNRVRDGMATISNSAAGVQADIAEAISDFNSDLSRTAPIIKAAVSKFDNTYGNPYYSFVISFFNKDAEEITVTTTITGATTLQSKSIRFKQGSRTVTSYTGVNITETVPCHEQGRFEFTIQSTTGSIVTVNATAGSTSFSKSFTLT